ncbi:hypothetical protein BD324DRAFT_627528 [Kockovaella imperatae]|uniref:Phosphogluconate dehydrogenase NAD-binding putative C-terminal domain-containing protein n=1 Tax=Kockovaella imperatae TaxID=4999 RepID=A0A1Y1UHA9_9TREE|nr:hypothetical protein BD324DRAFT_627528 [Kockovaella imperatae]ORX36876.1 hypothetical protein BD324DRAFT_627528 [Kockovaella imperatae]
MPYRTIGILYPGAMGASLAWTLHTRVPNLELLTSLAGRSKATKDRARSAGLVDVELSELVARSDIIISILPPSAALDMARAVLEHLPPLSKDSPPPVYIDANAISPGTVESIGKLLKEHQMPFIDGCVIGGPAKEGYDPMIYLSTESSHESILQDVASVLSGQSDSEGHRGLLVEVMRGAGQGAASALKMAYGGINKGTTGLAVLMVLAAHAHSPETAEALVKELARSRPDALKGFSSGFEAVIPKAYRFVGEMEENASFIRTALSSLPGSDKHEAEAVANTYEGLAKVFQRVADNVRYGESASSNKTETEAVTSSSSDETTGVSTTGVSTTDLSPAAREARASEIQVMKHFSARGRELLHGNNSKR